MKKQALYWSILILPFLVMIMVNEFVRLNTNEKGYTKGKWGLIQNITAINTAEITAITTQITNTGKIKTHTIICKAGLIFASLSTIKKRSSVLCSM